MVELAKEDFAEAMQMKKIKWVLDARQNRQETLKKGGSFCQKKAFHEEGVLPLVVTRANMVYWEQ
ncbi:MAG TPA: hypothetical protein VH593_31050 [Ktedonobacteraceae bacterium]|jgi:hypothetical protein